MPPGDLWSALGDADALRDRGLFVAEGRRVIQQILGGAAGGPDAIAAALATPAAAEALQLTSCLAGRLEVRSPDAMQALTGFNFHRGALALVRRPAPCSVAEVMAGADRSASGPHLSTSIEELASGPFLSTASDAPALRSRPVYVVGEQIADADNVGSLFRNARAFGATAVLLDDRSADPLYRKTVRTSLGAVLRVPWACGPLGDILAALAARDAIAVGLTPDPAAPTLADALRRSQAGTPGVASRGAGRAATAPIALLAGNEGAGLTPAARAACSMLARIPMAPGADSLNVATAVAVALYECQR